MPPGAHVDPVVVAIGVGLALVVEAVERVAARNLEAHVPQVEPQAGGEALLVVEDLVGLVLTVGAVEVVVVPVEAHVGPQRLDDLPGDASANPADRDVQGLQREALERLVLDYRERESNDGPETIGRHPRVHDAGNRHDLVEDLLVAGVGQREDPRVALALRDAE